MICVIRGMFARFNSHFKTLVSHCAAVAIHPMKFSWVLCHKRTYTVKGDIMTMGAQAIFWAAFVVLLSAFLWLFSDMITPFILGVAIAYLLNPVMIKLGKSKIPRSLSALFVLVLFFTFVSVAIMLLAPMALKQLQMLIEQAPIYFQSFLDYARGHLGWLETRLGVDPVAQAAEYIKTSGDKIAGLTGGLLGGLASGGKAMIDFVATLVLTPLVAFFMMKDWPKIVAWVEDLYPRRHETLIRRLLKNIDRKVAGFIRGQITVAFFLGLIYASALSVAGLNYGFLIGLGAGVFSIIPYVGSTLGLIVGMAVAWFQTGDLMYVGIIAAIFAVGQFVEGNFITPKIVGDSVGLHPLWIMFALIVGGGLFGITGMLIAIPVAAIVGVLGGFAIEQYKSSALYDGPKKPTKGSVKT